MTLETSNSVYLAFCMPLECELTTLSLDLEVFFYNAIGNVFCTFGQGLLPFFSMHDSSFLSQCPKDSACLDMVCVCFLHLCSLIILLLLHTLVFHLLLDPLYLWELKLSVLLDSLKFSFQILYHFQFSSVFPFKFYYHSWPELSSLFHLNVCMFLI